MSRRNEGEKNTAALFEVFGSVGIKFGQLASIWKLLGPEVAEDLKRLKSGAKKLEKIEHERILKANLTPEEFDLLDLSTLRNIANASMKVVDYVKLKDGTPLVAMIQRPNARDLIATSLDRTGPFIQRLQANGYKMPGGMAKIIVNSLGEQMGDELKGTKEYERVLEANKIYEDVNLILRDKLNGWEFAVPEVLSSDVIKPRDNLLFMHHIPDGKDFDHVPKEVKDELGQVVDEAAFIGLTKYGWLNTDPHAGNYLIDASRKKIWVLDHGQVSDYSMTSSWKTDERYQLARFIQAVSEKNASDTLKYIRQMSKGEILPPKQNALKAAISHVLEKSYPEESDQLIDLMNTLAEHNVELKTKFSFGALKGLIVQQGEAFETPRSFASTLEKAVKGILTEKAARYLLERPVPSLKMGAKCIGASIKSFISRLRTSAASVK